MKKKIAVSMLVGLMGFFAISCGNAESEKTSTQEDVTGNVIDDGSQKEGNFTNFGVTADAFINTLTRNLSEESIIPINSADMDTFYFLYFEGKNENDSLLITMDDNRLIESISLDTGIKGFDVIYKKCIEIINMDIDAEKLMSDLKTTPVITENDFSFSLSDDQLVILSYGGKVALVEESDPEEPTENSDEETNISSLTTGQTNALQSAKSYLDYSAFSHDGLISQLEYEGYSTEDSTYAADNCGADWNDQALKSALSYLDYSGFSYSGLIKQLEYEEFTTEQATYAADNCGADWNAEAAETAQSYMDYSSFSRSELIDQLKYEGFTEAQAEYGAATVGY